MTVTKFLDLKLLEKTDDNPVLSCFSKIQRSNIPKFALKKMSAGTWRVKANFWSFFDKASVKAGDLSKRSSTGGLPLLETESSI